MKTFAEFLLSSDDIDEEIKQHILETHPLSDRELTESDDDSDEQEPSD